MDNEAEIAELADALSCGARFQYSKRIGYYIPDYASRSEIIFETFDDAKKYVLLSVDAHLERIQKVRDEVNSWTADDVDGEGVYVDSYAIRTKTEMFNTYSPCTI